MLVKVFVPEATPGNASMLAIEYASAEDLVATLSALQSPDSAVIVSTGLDEAGQVLVASAVRSAGLVCVEVRLDRWDGFTPSPLSAACRGVIAGFGASGVNAAVEFLESLA